MNYRRSVCKFCGASIVWAKRGERNVPIDFEPVARGYVILFQALGSDTLEAIAASEFRRSQPELLPLYRDRHVPHAMTCTRER